MRVVIGWFSELDTSRRRADGTFDLDRRLAFFSVYAAGQPAESGFSDVDATETSEPPAPAVVPVARPSAKTRPPDSPTAHTAHTGGGAVMQASRPPPAKQRRCEPAPERLPLHPANASTAAMAPDSKRRKRSLTGYVRAYWKGRVNMTVCNVVLLMILALQGHLARRARCPHR